MVVTRVPLHGSILLALHQLMMALDPDQLMITLARLRMELMAKLELTLVTLAV